jgi:hypothetical protein
VRAVMCPLSNRRAMQAAFCHRVEMLGSQAKAVYSYRLWGNDLTTTVRLSCPGKPATESNRRRPRTPNEKVNGRHRRPSVAPKLSPERLMRHRVAQQPTEIAQDESSEDSFDACIRLHHSLGLLSLTSPASTLRNGASVGGKLADSSNLP